MNCAICGDPSDDLRFYGATCSQECARVAQLTNALGEIEHILREMMLNQGRGSMR